MTEINPSFSTARVLKPFDGFETIYQGQSATIPIAMPSALDFEAGKPGYDPFLATAAPVPKGSRIVLWIPLTLVPDSESPTPPLKYRYQLVWRLRNVREYNDTAAQPTGQQKLFSLPNDAFGVQDNGADRVIVPCGMESVVYEQNEPGIDFANGTVNVRGIYVVPDGGLSVLPLLPSGQTSSYGQGTFVNSSQTPSAGAGYMIYETTAQGDELVLWVRRETVAGGDLWDFTSTDQPFSAVYGTNNGSHPSVPDLGVFLFTGTP